MTFAFLLALTATAGGVVATYLYDDEASLPARLCAGVVVGFSALALVGFVLASLFGLSPLSLLLAGLLVASPLALLMDPSRRARVGADFQTTARWAGGALLNPDRRTFVTLTFYECMALMLWFVFARALFEKPDGLYTGILNNYGDLPFHIAIITGFAYGDNFPPQDPIFAGARFTYPFLMDFLTAMLVRSGAGLRDALLLTNFPIALALVGLLHRWAWLLTRDRIAALLTPLLVLLNGGLGWWLLVQDMRQNEHGLLAVLGRLTHDYTIISGTVWRFGNVVTLLLVTQRSILLGLPLAIIVFTLWWQATQEREEKGLQAAPTAATLSPLRQWPLCPATRRMIVAGALAGQLPLVHGHSFAVVLMVGAAMALLSGRRQEWIAFFGTALIVAVPELAWMRHQSAIHAASFFGWHFGWDRGDENFFVFWLENTGLFIPLIAAALLGRVTRGRRANYIVIPANMATWLNRRKDSLVSRPLLLFYAPFLLCFLVPNLVKLAPWVWDNIKVLIYWYIASVPLVALWLARQWRNNGGRRAAAVALTLSLTLAGGLDMWRIVSNASEYREFDTDQMALARIIRQDTAPHALILHAPIHNHPVYLTGRRSLMGFPGHVWTHGIDLDPRENDIRRMYAGGPDAAALMARYGVQYVVVSPLERGLSRSDNA